ncbi:TetR/AcrR family transcriptional regulator [Actinokineospora sp. NBRC 105648]|uniref:TetR/AcrR family transcriptional regulator n=1 Tax=Actinokineospora sp. NBRC 105648 TaxID=3032206 RepID=UPI0024A3C5A3|nr:TetR/AcrR family transcriptional regulator [Actinokineospora sp. NBRC 105648]GLZ40023.1 TetR family transcriptional regulator [Actinokineospora sp. NBRC 105648]
MSDTRERILRAVLRVIAEEGVAGVTNRRVAREAAVSLGSITYHFATQTDLLRDSLLLFVGEETTRLAALAEAQRGAAVTVEQAAVLVQRVAETLPSEIAPLELYLHAGRDPALRGAAAACFAAYDQLAVEVLTALGVPSPDRLAGPVVALVAGTQLRALATGTAPAVADALLLLVSPAAR